MQKLDLIVDPFPILDYLPPCVAAWMERGSRLYQRQVQPFEKNIEAALWASSWNWTKAEPRLREVKHLELEELAFIIRVLYEAAHTTPMVLEVLIMVSVLHQDPVCRA
jgi:hypothetical protein